MFPLQASSELTKSDGLIVLLGLLFIALRVMDEFSEVGRRQGQWSLERGLSAAEWLRQHPVISSEEKKKSLVLTFSFVGRIFSPTHINEEKNNNTKDVVCGEKGGSI